MKVAFGSKGQRDAQTLVFFGLAVGVIFLLCGLAIDSGLLYLAKAKMGRAVDGAALAAVGNFHRSNNAATNRDNVAVILRNFAVANYTDLSSISATIATSGGSPVAGKSNTYEYDFDDLSGSDNFNGQAQDANGQYKRFVQITLTTGSGGGITSATCNARCPVHTYFIGLAGNFFRDLKVSSSATATRNPRLIMIVVDRSASMLSTTPSIGGAYGLPQAVVEFLDFFDTSSDNIGIVSFGSSARLEMPITTNFIYAGTNVMTDAYQTNGSTGVPGVDPEQKTTNPDNIYYATGGVRRMKFGGQTAADEGIRLGLETMMANSGFNDPDVLKYMVIFTDGAWNTTRSLFAAPGYKNITVCPGTLPTSSAYVSNSTPWNDQDMTQNTNIVPVPVMSPMPYVTNAIVQDSYGAYGGTYSYLLPNHLNDIWQSIDTSGYEPLNSPTTTGSSPTTNGVYTNDTWVGVSANGQTNYYTQNLDVWLQPGSVDYAFNTNSVGTYICTPYVSDYTNPTQHISITLHPGDSNVLVVPGYVVDGLAFDLIDMPYSPVNDGSHTWYRTDNFEQPYMWPDDTNSAPPAITAANHYHSGSLKRQMMFRNYVNLLTGFYIFRADEPTETYNSGNPVNYQGVEPLITEDTNGGPRSYYGLGPYYPSAGFYWPFDLVGVDHGISFGLRDPNVDPSGNGDARHIAYSINMLSTAAAPNWYGELFYRSTTGGGTSSTSGTGTTSISTPMVSADWYSAASQVPSYILTSFNQGLMVSDPIHDANVITSPSTWRPSAFNGNTGSGSSFTDITDVSPSDSLNYTGGYVTDGAGNYYRNTMAWSGRPTHYYDFSQSKWIPIGSNHTISTQFLPLGYWKAQEYAWHARAAGVTIYTVGYGGSVGQAQQVILAQIANATNTTAGGGSNISYNPSQPIGQQFQATTTNEIYSDFQSIGQAINESLTQ
ncbi:MAG: pilus assembly protein TadG-related protein [Methylacidiphilales bacterium]|nr:pilus assembly protein TadG-related protein [Candidatus Methylacidiphilales bacterium]